MKKILAFIMTLTLVSGLVFTFGAEETYAASGSYKLPTKITNYEYKQGKWKKIATHKYKYDSKGNIIYWDGSKLKPTYKKSKLKKVVATGEGENGYKFVTTKLYNSKGKIIECDTTGPSGDEFHNTLLYSYNGKGYIRKMQPETCARNYKYKYHKNGLPKQITRTNMDDFEDFKVKIVEKYNKQGIMTSGKRYEDGKLKGSWKKKITRKNGKITQIVTTNSNGTKYKCVYTYGSARTKSKKTYASIMGMTQGSLIFEAIGDNSAVGWCY